MCQINSKPVKKKTVRAVRVYRAFEIGDRSLFLWSPRPKTGKWTKKKRTKFHACQTLSDARRMIKSMWMPPLTPVFYEVELAGKIWAGLWSDEPAVSTYTANRMKVIRRIK